MSNPYVGEIRMAAFNFAPAGWMFCQGQLLPISEYETLFNLIGTTYGGDGQSTFQLPNIQGRIPVHQGTDSGENTYTLAQAAGVESVTLTTNQLPLHSHPMQASTSPAAQPAPGGNVPAQAVQNLFVAPSPNVVNMSAATDLIGGSLPHDNMMPYLVVSFIISLFGIFPSQT